MKLTGEQEQKVFEACNKLANEYVGSRTKPQTILDFAFSCISVGYTAGMARQLIETAPDVPTDEIMKDLIEDIAVAIAVAEDGRTGSHSANGKLVAFTEHGRRHREMAREVVVALLAERQWWRSGGSKSWVRDGWRQKLLEADPPKERKMDWPAPDISIGAGVGMTPAKCPCRSCVAERTQGLVMHMVLCPNCGNKRCPHATDHRLGCTQSNEPGQAGSAYE